jgi:hypothetical protein
LTVTSGRRGGSGHQPGLKKICFKNSSTKNTIELTPCCKFDKTVHVQHLPRCGKHARHTETSDGLLWMPAEAMTGVVNLFPSDFFDG